MDRAAYSQKINQHTTLIDVGMRGLARVTAVYLVQGTRRSCLIDAGTRAEAPRVASLLAELGAFPPDIIIATHAHHDHAQGIPILRLAAQELGHGIEVHASTRCISLLADASYNEVFDHGPYQPIETVSPLKEGDNIDLGEVNLTIIDLPGHSADHIGIMDEQARTLYLGDALGLNVGGVYLPPFVPPSWNPRAFRASVGKVLQLSYETLCLGHYGCLCGDDARKFPEMALAWTNAWWELFQHNQERLDDADYLFEVVQQELEPGIPDLALVAQGQRETRAAEPEGLADQPQPPGELFMRGLVAKLALGCRKFRAEHSNRG